ncbi:MAG: glycosyltransferase family 39 protein, partial [Pseudomonadota bacterium]
MNRATGCLDFWGHRLLAALETRFAIAIVLVAALWVVVPGQAQLPVTDRDEARFAQASKQMVETGDLIDIRMQEEPRWKKPAGIYWLQAASATAFGGPDAPIWAYRLPSALAALAAALAMLWAAQPFTGRGAAALAAIMLATAVLFAAEANIAKTDAALMLTGVLTLGALGHLLLGSGGVAAALILWTSLAAAILLKGPIIPVIAVLAVAGFWILRRPSLRPLRALWGIPLMALLVLPWLVAIWQISDGGFFAESLGKDL